MTSKIFVETTDLGKVNKQGQVRAADTLNLTLRWGEIYVLSGVNGTGITKVVKLDKETQTPDVEELTWAKS